MTWPSLRITLIGAVFVLAATTAPAASAHSPSTFSNSLGIQLFADDQASPYPSPIDVSGMTGTLYRTTVTLHGVTADTPALDILLETPGGKSIMLSSDVNISGSSAASNSDWTFDDGAVGTQADGGTGTYRPNNDPGTDSDVPTPTVATGEPLSDLNGDSPNGTWKLYIADGFVSSTFGGITSWSLTIDTNVPDMTPSPTSHDFGSLNDGSMSTPQTFKMSSDGNNTLHVTGVHVDGPNASEFAVSSNGCAEATLPPDGICNVDVTFDPTSPGAKSANLVIDSDGLQSPQSIPLTGSGVGPALTIAPVALDFGALTLPVTGVAQAVTLTNTGNDTLVFSGTPALGGANPGDFTLSDSTCISGLAPGASCGFNVNFTPTSEGAKSAAVLVPDNAFGSPQTLPLAGTALPAPAPSAQESGSPDVKIESATFQGNSPTVGQPTYLDVVASDPNAQVTGVIADFGEALGLFAESGCVVGKNSGGTSTFHVPYEFLTPGPHTITVTVFAGGCGAATTHTLTFTVNVAAAKIARAAAYRVAAHASDTIVGPAITSKCKNKNLVPTKTKTKLIVNAILCIINEQRKLAHLKPLKPSKKLAKAAGTHDKAMIAGHFFAHQGPKEPALVTRLRRAKYIGSAGENIGAGAGSLAAPLGMVDGWMHSTLHRANILSKKWKTVGIGFLAQFPLSTPARPVATYTTDFGTKP